MPALSHNVVGQTPGEVARRVPEVQARQCPGQFGVPVGALLAREQVRQEERRRLRAGLVGWPGELRLVAAGQQAASQACALPVASRSISSPQLPGLAIGVTRYRWPASSARVSASASITVLVPAI